MLFNKSLSAGIFPSKWKSAFVMSLYKKGDKHCPGNYRPVTLLSCLGNLMEKYVYKHMFNYLISNKLINEKQAGFVSYWTFDSFSVNRHVSSNSSIL